MHLAESMHMLAPDKHSLVTIITAHADCQPITTWNLLPEPTHEQALSPVTKSTSMD